MFDFKADKLTTQLLVFSLPGAVLETIKKLPLGSAVLVTILISMTSSLFD